MASLSSQLYGTQITELVDRLGRLSRITPDVVKALAGDDEAMKWWGEQLKNHPKFRLDRGKFHSIQEKLQMVREWPGVTGQMIEQACVGLEEKVAFYENAIPDRPQLDIVVSVYRHTVGETVQYALERIGEAFGGRIWLSDKLKGDLLWRVQYGEGNWGDRYAQVVTGYRDCVRVELVDLDECPREIPTENGTLTYRRVRQHDAAHMAVLYAAAQDPEWFKWQSKSTERRICDGVIVSGLEVNVGEVPGDGRKNPLHRFYPDWNGLISLYYAHGNRKLHIGVNDLRAQVENKAFPVIVNP
jgi:hypothetical protein